MEGKKEKKIHFDDVFGFIGEMGLFQWVIFVVMLFGSAWGVESIYMVFVAAELPTWCKVDEVSQLPFEVQKNVMIPYDEEEGEYLQCEHYMVNHTGLKYPDDYINWDRSWSENLTTQPCTEWVYDHKEFASTVVSEWDLVCDREDLSPLVSTIYFAGVLVGVFVCGYASDSLGRKKAALIFLVLKCGGNFLSAFAPNYETFCVARFTLGFGGAGFALPMFVLGMEIIGKSWRSFVALVYQLAFTVGYMLLSGFAYAIRDHVKLQVIAAAPPVLFFSLIFICPESPRWLLAKERYEDADRVLHQIAAINGRQIPTDFDVRNIIITSEEDNYRKASFKDLFRHPTVRKITLIVCLHWFTDSLVYYAVSLNAGSLSGDIFLNNFLAGLVEVPAIILSIFTCDWRLIGRRGTNGGALIIAGAASLITIPLILVEGLDDYVTAFALIGKAGATAGFCAIYLYTSELFPTEVRNIGLGTASMCARISGMAAPFIGGPMVDLWEPLPYLIYGVLGTVTGIVTFFLPETLGQKLPQTIDDIILLSKKQQKYTTDSTDEVESKNKGFDNMERNGVQNKAFTDSDM